MSVRVRVSSKRIAPDANCAGHEGRRYNMAEQISAAEFQQKVLEADKPVLVDFFATWCGPCKMMAPIIEEVAQEKAGQAYVYKVDVDEAQQVAAQYGIMSIPTLILFENGQAKKQVIGAQPKPAVLSLFN